MNHETHSLKTLCNYIKSHRFICIEICSPSGFANTAAVIPVKRVDCHFDNDGRGYMSVFSTDSKFDNERVSINTRRPDTTIRYCRALDIYRINIEGFELRIANGDYLAAEYKYA